MNQQLSLSNAPQHTQLQQIIRLLSGVFFLAVASQISIPLQPVPITFQSAAVILLAIAYGARMGTITVITYFIVGATGIPVFANFASGLNMVYTNGYLIGFIPAAFVAGYLSEKGFASNPYRAFLTACISTSIIFACGIYTLQSLIGLHDAIAVGLMPFVFSEPLKLMIASLLAPRLSKNQ